MSLSQMFIFAEIALGAVLLALGIWQESLFASAAGGALLVVALIHAVGTGRIGGRP